MRQMLSSDFASPVIAALIWMVITLATGGSVVFAFVGAIILLAVVYAIQEAYRRLTARTKTRG